MSFERGELLIGASVKARAHVNIALIKYWGKAPARDATEANLPAVPSLSLSLDALYTDTTVVFAPDAPNDFGSLNGQPMDAATLARCRPVLDRVRELSDVASRFEIISENHVPTAAGLASSASSMAALAAAAATLTGLTDPSGKALSALARLGSGSACRSVFGGWVSWAGHHAQPVAPRDHWDLSLVVAVVSSKPKALSSREAMQRTARTSPFYAGWVQSAPALFEEGLAALKRRDLALLCDVMETSTYRMHACAMGARPPVLYWQSPSLAAIEVVKELRSEGRDMGWTMDAGPNVKVLCRSADAEDVREALLRVPGVGEALITKPGPGVRVSVKGGA